MVYNFLISSFLNMYNDIIFINESENILKYSGSDSYDNLEGDELTSLMQGNISETLNITGINYVGRRSLVYYEVFFKFSSDFMKPVVNIGKGTFRNYVRLFRGGGSR